MSSALENSSSPWSEFQEVASETIKEFNVAFATHGKLVKQSFTHKQPTEILEFPQAIFDAGVSHWVSDSVIYGINSVNGLVRVQLSKRKDKVLTDIKEIKAEEIILMFENNLSFALEIILYLQMEILVMYPSQDHTPNSLQKLFSQTEKWYDFILPCS